jgi:hypothetical protein
VARTREWNSAEVRTRTAEECAALSGYADLADILRTKRCVLLKKVHLLFLARVWNYRCDLWCRRGERLRGHARAQPQTAVAAAAAAMAAAAAAPPTHPADDAGAASGASAGPLHVSAPVQPEAVMAYVAKTLRPLALESARLGAGRRAAAAASAGGCEAAHLSHDTLSHLRAVQACFAAAEAAAAGVHAALCDEAHELSADAAAMPAWSGLSADALAAEALVAGLLQLCTSLATATQRRGATPCLSPSEAVWLDELWQAQLLASECAARAQLVLLRVKTQPRCVFLAGAAVIIEALVTFLSSSRANMARREAWVARLVASRPAVGDSSPTAAAGAKSGSADAAAQGSVELPPALAAVVATYAGGALAAWDAAATACGGGGGGGRGGGGGGMGIGMCAAGEGSGGGGACGGGACGEERSARADARPGHAPQAGSEHAHHAAAHARDVSCA